VNERERAHLAMLVSFLGAQEKAARGPTPAGDLEYIYHPSWETTK